MNATQNETGIDNFEIRVGDGSVKRVYENGARRNKVNKDVCGTHQHEPPAIHYAGWSAMNASQNETGVDDFDLSVGAGSTKRDFDNGRAEVQDEGSFPTFDFPGATASFEPDVIAGATPSGKATATGSITYTWTPLDALESATTPEGTVTYTYDGDGLRIKKISGGDEVIYIRDGAGQIIAEYDGQGNLLAEYVYAMGRRIAKISASGMRFYYHSDNVGTPLAITDQNGNLSWRGEYLPFGPEFSSTDPGDHFKFTGKELEDHTGLYYFEARYYDPVTGRFITVDPVGGSVENSQSWNRYTYVLNNPLNMVDPTGTVALVDDAVIGLAFLTAATVVYMNAPNPISPSKTNAQVLAVEIADTFNWIGQNIEFAGRRPPAGGRDPYSSPRPPRGIPRPDKLPALRPAHEPPPAQPPPNDLPPIQPGGGGFVKWVTASVAAQNAANSVNEGNGTPLGDGPFFVNGPKPNAAVASHAPTHVNVDLVQSANVFFR